jgi:hypothetical protein
MPGSGVDDSDESGEEDSMVSSYLSGRPQLHRKTSSVPSISLPTIPKRKPVEPSTPKSAMRDISLPKPSPKDAPSTAPSKLQTRQPSASRSLPTTPVQDKPPPPPPHRTPSQQQVKFAPTPTFTPNSQVKRRSSSPLKHEYQPSSPSLSSELSSEDSASQYSDDSMTEESSEDELDDGDDIASSLISSLVSKTIPAARAAHALPSKPSPPETIYSQPNSTLKPSESASQGPYRTVPVQQEKAAKSIASIFCWSDRGQWQILHADECSIIVSPGLIQAYEMTAEHSTDAVPNDRPLVALELTPIVPLRRGTALDITIRSPATPASKLQPGNNIMFRSRSTDECEVLYSLINRARINNPTYIALQNARPPTGESSWASVMDRNNGASGGGSSSWWQFGTSTSRSKSYRASTRAPSTAGNTESSVGTISSVMNAMKRLSGSSKILDSAKSRMSLSRDGGSDESGGSGGGSPIAFVDPKNPGEGLGPMGPSLGITNAKIRLYVRQPKGGKWQDLGSARLSIMQRELDQGINTPAMIQTGVEKRIIVTGKGKTSFGSIGGAAKPGALLLDATLGESCFERVARTGIAVSVWEDVVGQSGGVAATGGVAEKRIRVFMLQVCLWFSWTEGMMLTRS